MPQTINTNIMSLNAQPWVYPLYTPAGHQVLQEFAFDHPFHNGCFVGLHPVVYAERRERPRSDANHQSGSVSQQRLG